MEEIYEVALSKVISEFHLETIYLPDLPENIKITCARVNQPGLQMVGFYDHYEQARLQIIGTNLVPPKNESTCGNCIL